MSNLSDFLAHHGVKGMKWGRRKSQGVGVLDLTRAETGEKRAITYNPAKLKVSEDMKTFEGSRREAKRVQAQIDLHGRDLKAHPDHRAATSARNKANVYGLDKVSNKEIQEFITRANLEQNYSKLNPAKKRAGEKFVKDLLSNTGKQVASEYAKKGVTALIKTATK